MNTINQINTINQNDILNKIINEICRIHPIKNPRKSDTTYSEMEIYFTFGKCENSPVTAIGFLDGNDKQKRTTSTRYRLNEYIAPEIVSQIIAYLIKEFPYISDFSVYSRSFKFDFQYPLEMENQEGISCNKIILEFSAQDNKFVQILNTYLSNILLEFTDELSQTPTFQYKYNEYCKNLQNDIIDSLNDDEIEQLIINLPIGIKRILLKGISYKYFSQVYSDTQSQDIKILSKQITSKK